MNKKKNNRISKNTAREFQDKTLTKSYKQLE